MSKLKIPLLSISVLALVISLVLGILIMNRRKSVDEKLYGLFQTHYPELTGEVKTKPTEEKITTLARSVSATHENLKSTEQKLKDTQGQLSAANTERDAAKKAKDEAVAAKTAVDRELAATKDQLAQATAQAGQLKNQVASLQKNVEELKPFKEQIDQMKQKLGDLPKQFEELSNTKMAYEAENRILGEDNIKLQKRIVELSTVPSDLKGKVIMSDPQWGFVILNIGRDDRVIDGTEFYVFRDSKVQGKIRVSKADKKVSIADILPGPRGKIAVGDSIAVTQLAATEKAAAPAPASKEAPKASPAPAPKATSTPAPKSAPAPALPSPAPKQNFGPRG